MKVQELFEVATSKIDFKVKTNKGSYFETEAVIDGRVIIFDARRMGGKVQVGKKQVVPWEVEFTSETEDGEQTAIRTGLGNEFQITSFVVTSLKEFVKQIKPEVITFTSSKLDAHSRSSLYTKMFKRALPNYSLSTVDRDDGDYEVTTAVKK